MEINNSSKHKHVKEQIEQVKKEIEEIISSVSKHKSNKKMFLQNVKQYRAFLETNNECAKQIEKNNLLEKDLIQVERDFEEMSVMTELEKQTTQNLKKDIHYLNAKSIQIHKLDEDLRAKLEESKRIKDEIKKHFQSESEGINQIFTFDTRTEEALQINHSRGVDNLSVDNAESTYTKDDDTSSSTDEDEDTFSEEKDARSSTSEKV